MPPEESVVNGESSDARLLANRDTPSMESLTYSCALNREILVQGRIFIGEGHVCFYANILGWVTSVVISFRDIVVIEKRNTALLFPNAIQISTLHHRYFFTSFVFREQAFAKMTKSWKLAIGDKFQSEAYLHGELEKGLGGDMFRDDSPLAQTSRALAVSTLQPSTLFPHVSSSLKNSVSDDGVAPCGCDVHFCNEALSLVLKIPLEAVHTPLFESKNSFWTEFYRTIFYEGATVDGSEWETPLCGGEQRRYAVNIPIPTILDLGQHANCRVTEKYLLKQPTRRYVVEATFELDGIPGGQAQVIARYCLSAEEDIQTKVLVTFDVFPPRSSFFKESIKQSLTVQFSEFYQALGRALTQLSARFGGIPGDAPLMRRLSWWRRHQASSRQYQHSSSSTTVVRIYFDWAAFWRSLFWLVPIIVLFLAVVYIHVVGRSVAEPLDADARLQRIKSVQEQFRSFVEQEQAATHSLSLHVNEMVDRLVARVSDLDQHIQLVAKQDHNIE